MPAGDALMRRAEVREAELALCQILCAECHKDKTIAYVRENVLFVACAVAGCTRRHDAHGLCGTHATRAARGQSINSPVRAYQHQSGICSVADCGDPAKCKRMCKRHYDRDLRRRKHSVAA